MKNMRMLFCIRKDTKEFFRTRKNIIFSITILGLCAMVFLATLSLPTLIEALLNHSSNIFSSPEELPELLQSFFPQDLKANMGILASDIIIFFGIVAILTTHNIVNREQQSGRWIFPLGAGYTFFELVFSKGLVYGIGAALPCSVFYNTYGMLGRLYLIPNYKIKYMVLNSLILGYVIFFTVYITIIISARAKHTLSVATTIIMIILFAPDILALFSFGRYLPTHLLTFLYRSGSDVIEIILPLIFCVLLQIVLTINLSKRRLR